MTSSRHIRFPTLNLRRNPFGELTAEERSRLVVCDLSRAAAWLAERPPGGRLLEFIGPCGHGKTSHLLALRHHVLPAMTRWLSPRTPLQFVSIPPARPYPALPPNGWLLIDEADRAPWRMRRRFLRERRVLAIGVHRSLATAFERRGVEVQTIRVAIGHDAHRLHQILQLRLQSARGDQSRPIPSLTLRDAKLLIARFGDDIRAIEDYLYERFQTLGEMQDGQV